MHSAPRKLSKVETQLRTFALAYPDATEEFPWGERVIRVKGKIFVFFGQPPEGGYGIGVKLPVSSEAALAMPFAEPSGYGLGKHGWVSAKFATAAEMPVDLLKEWIDESYRAVAPKSVLAKLESQEAPKPKRKK